MFGIASLNPFISVKQPSIKTATIEVGDTISPIISNKDLTLDVPRFQNDTVYHVQPGMRFRVKELVRGYYKGEVFHPVRFFGKKYYLLEGIDNSGFISSYRGSTVRRDDSTKAIYLPIDQVTSRFRKVKVSIISFSARRII